MPGKCSAMVLLAAWMTVSAGLPALAHAPQSDDEILRQIGVEEKTGGRIPADLVFKDADGADVRLGDALGDGPSILTLNYYTCPMLCPLTLRNLLATVDAVEGISLARDFRIVTVSIDPDETREAAAARAAEMHALMKGIPDPGTRWRFLYGGRDAIGRLAAAAGFRFVKVGKEFAHPDADIVLTPDGRISRYLYGVQQDPADLKIALIEAADGRIGSSRIMNRVILYCFHYDPAERKYALYATNIMKAGGVLTLALLGILYLALWRKRAGRSVLPGKGKTG